MSSDDAQRGEMSSTNYQAVMDRYKDSVLPDFGAILDPAGSILKDCSFLDEVASLPRGTSGPRSWSSAHAKKWSNRLETTAPPQTWPEVQTRQTPCLITMNQVVPAGAVKLLLADPEKAGYTKPQEMSNPAARWHV